MSKPSLMILSLGELGTNMLEASARSDLFDSIILGSRNLTKAQERANNALIGAGTEGHFPKITAEQLDFTAPDFAQKISDIAPDYLFTAPSMLPWWKIGDDVDLPFAGFTSLHLSLMVKLRNALSEATCRPFWIGASYPDVVNAVLNRSGHGPDCGIGNVLEPVAKIQHHVASRIGCPPQEVNVQLVAQHAFEYYVLNAQTHTKLPPHLLKARVGNQDVSDIAGEALNKSFPFPYDLHFNRVTASAGIHTLRALTSDKPLRTHIPGIGSYLGGYPVLASTQGITFDLPTEWSLEQAISTNEASLPWDGLASVDADGTIHFTDQTSAALGRLLGKPCDHLTVATADQQARALLAAL